MKLFILSILLLAVFQTCFAQKYEYNIIGEHFSDTLYTNKGSITTTANPIVVRERKALFERPKDTTYIYHLVGEGENTEYLVNLYQICAPCFAKWNKLSYADFNSFRNQKLYTGEYLKVALKTDYEKGVTEKVKTRKYYQNIKKRTYIYDIVRNYNININDLRSWNGLSESAYYVEDVRLIVGEIEYKYTCPCLE
ncbi:hypothetical protein ACE193_13415 [Bernardetia sp. OM2101]|uniref:hypothetical protein n=1 Tax=Bernardetia sp. OM2101 TaxID=3344876 RepID=UPI0035D11422